MIRKPTPRRQRRYDSVAVLAYIATYQRHHQQRSPSQRRIQISLGVSAPSVVHNLLRRLEHSGLLTITAQRRGYTAELTLTEAGYDAVQSWQEAQAVSTYPTSTAARQVHPTL